jgi:hypothetical protein
MVEEKGRACSHVAWAAGLRGSVGRGDATFAILER